MEPKYIQFDCKETDELDLRQANAVLRYEPDIIILEYPNNNKTPNLVFNKYDALKKPKDLVRKRLKKFPDEILKTHPWVKADTIMWKNVVDLWAKDHQVFILRSRCSPRTYKRMAGCMETYISMREEKLGLVGTNIFARKNNGK